MTIKKIFLALGGFKKWISLTDRQIRAKLIYDLLVIMLQKSLMPFSIGNEKKKVRISFALKTAIGRLNVVVSQNGKNKRK